MRPLRLVLQGFRSHSARTEIDFTGRSLIAIVGPTGAGKSSILDGISYALYGKTTRVQKDTKSLISSSCDSTEVRLAFEVDGIERVVTRSMRRRGAGVHVLENATGEPIIGDARVTEAISELLHLDFSGFCSSVLLAQGRFSEFLDATPDRRTRILKGVFRFDQLDAMREAAGAHRSRAELERARVEGALGQIPDDVAELLEAARVALATASARVARLEAARPEERDLLERHAGAAGEVTRARAALARLEALGAELASGEDVDRLCRDEEELRDPLAKARALLEEARERRRAAGAELADLEASLGTRAELLGLRLRAEGLVEAAAEVVAAEEAARAAQAMLEASEAAADGARSEEKAAGAAIEALVATRIELERAHAAHSLRARLAPGQACPVCEQVVARVPAAELPEDLGALEAGEADARLRHEQASAAARAAMDALASARVRVEQTAAAREDGSARVAAHEEALRARLGEVSDPLAEVEERLRALDEAEARRDDARAQAESIEVERDRLEASWSALEGRRADIVHALGHVASILERPRPAPSASATELRDHAVELGAALGAARERAQAGVAEAEAAGLELTTRLRALRVSLDVDPDVPLEVPWAESVGQRGVAEDAVARLESQAARAAELERERSAAATAAATYSQLYEDLANTRFVDFLLEDKRRVLSELATHQLKEMTGRYRFDDSGAFRIVDELNADIERSVETLSGGETFLASLALALGLAEAVTRHGGRLRCFFLDEGFGSLDPESFDRALDGIERIVRQDRLIGLVSHVPALADRIPDKIVLERADEGMSRVAEGAGNLG